MAESSVISRQSSVGRHTNAELGNTTRSTQFASRSTLDAPGSPAPLLPDAFPNSGWYVMRNHSHYLAAKAGGNGADGWGLHAHNDALSFEFSIGERNFLVDSGSYVYTGDYRARNAFRSTAAHNTLRLDGAEINRIPEFDMFRLENDAQVRVLEWDSTGEGDTLIAEHNGYAQRLGVIHRREFHFDRATGNLRVRDRLLAAPDSAVADQQRKIEIFFHFAPMPVACEGLALRTACPSGPNLVITATQADGLSLSLAEGWISPRYGVRVAAPVACYAAQALLPAEFEFSLTSTTE